MAWIVDCPNCGQIVANQKGEPVLCPQCQSADIDTRPDEDSNSSCTKEDMDKNTKNAMYHACRQAFVCGQERVPWHMTLHAIREGLNMEDCKTYNLKEKDYENHSQLRELVQWLKSLSESTEQPSPTFIISASDNGG